MNTYQGHIVDAVSREIFDGELVVDDGRIVQVNRCELPGDEKQWPYLMPGFIDSHVHIESSMMMPVEFARVAASHGTIGVIADPHEIANVMGVNYFFNKNMQLNLEYAYVNDRTQDRNNYNILDVQLDFRF